MPPPPALKDLKAAATQVLASLEMDAAALPFAVVLLSNEVWRPVVARVPYQRRLLLLPQCLRDESRCQASIDPMGLQCRQCGCHIGELLTEARRLGYLTLVAEGSAVVTSLIEAGKIDAIIGVSCLSMLEKVFPFMEAAAVPGIALPLLTSDCRTTKVDMDWVWEAISLTSGAGGRATDLETLRRRVAGWFAEDALEGIMGPVRSQTERIARLWLARSGKRWRPFLAACAYGALAQAGEGEQDLRKVAVAVECFHKASLVHDDIEDGDSLRDGKPTLHAEHGIEIALNVGDFLLGEGYRMIGECLAPADRKAAMSAAAARGHRELCLGQGAELWWMRNPGPLSSLQVLDIFRQKTAPAFDVALHLGALCAGADGDISLALTPYSECLGIAYQIQDDLADFLGGTMDLAALRPSICLALAYESATGADRELLAAAMSRQPLAAEQAARLAAVVRRLDVQTRATSLLEQYKDLSARSLAQLRSPELAIILRRVTARIFPASAPMPCCDDATKEPAP
jgi:geranylgeranyl pyrophosphate synthase